MAIKKKTFRIKNYMKKNNSNWKTIEEEFRKKFVKLQDVTKFNDERCSYDYVPSKRDFKILAFFKPYFQEQRHEESVRELEDEYPLYKKEYNELPEIVDNTNTDRNP